MPRDEIKPFAGLAGSGVRIGVIDSGAHPDHPHIGRIAGGVSIGPQGEIDDQPEAWLDRLGHGTAVTAAIQEGAPEAEIFVVKVFDETLRASASALVRAMDWCLERRMDIVNLSLGSTNPAYVDGLSLATGRCLTAGALLVAARETQGMLCYPGCLPGVLGVALDWDCPRERYYCRRIGDEFIFYASGYPRSIPGIAQIRNLHGVSFAVANMTAFAARAYESQAGRNADVLSLLVGEALRRDDVNSQ